MLPARIEGANMTFKQPDDWNEPKLGHCRDLSIRHEVVEGMPMMRSAWEVEGPEAMHLACGGRLLLGISGSIHPVVNLAVQTAPAQLTRTTLVREIISARGELTVTVETLFPPLPGLDQKAQRGLSSGVVGPEGSPATVAGCMLAIERLAIERGWISA